MAKSLYLVTEDDRVVKLTPGDVNTIISGLYLEETFWKDEGNRAGTVKVQRVRNKIIEAQRSS